MLINQNPTTVANMMKVSTEDREKGKGAERDTGGIRVAVTALDSAVSLITKI